VSNGTVRDDLQCRESENHLHCMVTGSSVINIFESIVGSVSRVLPVSTSSPRASSRIERQFPSLAQPPISSADEIACLLGIDNNGLTYGC
jgi:hypothetical protein